METSRGNEDMEKALKKRIGRDVIAKDVLTFAQFKPYDGGMEFNQVLVIDVGGWLPNWTKKIVSTKCAKIGIIFSRKLMRNLLHPRPLEDHRNDPELLDPK